MQNGTLTAFSGSRKLDWTPASGAEFSCCWGWMDTSLSMATAAEAGATASTPTRGGGGAKIQKLSFASKISIADKVNKSRGRKKNITSPSYCMHIPQKTVFTRMG
jgi:hypothetical protein